MSGSILCHREFGQDPPSKSDLLEEWEDAQNVEQVLLYRGVHRPEGIVFSGSCEPRLTQGDGVTVTFQPFTFTREEIVTALQGLAGRIECEGLASRPRSHRANGQSRLRLKAKLLQQMRQTCEPLQAIHFFGDRILRYVGLQDIALIEPVDAIWVAFRAELELTTEVAASMLLELAFEIETRGFPIPGNRWRPEDPYSESDCDEDGSEPE